MKKRFSQYEYLRLLAMFFIVLSHYAVHGQREIGLGQGIEGLVLQSLSGLGNLGVILFIFISTYFLVDKPVQLQASRAKFFNLAWLMIFYEILISLALSLSQGQWIERPSFAPFGDSYWFLSYYLIFILASPFIHDLISSLSLAYQRHLLLFLTVVWVGGQTTGLIDLTMGYQRAFLFFYSYVLMAVYKKQGISCFNSHKKALAWLILSLFGMGLVQSLAYQGLTLFNQDVDIYRAFSYFHPLMMGLALSIFSLFSQSSIGYHPRINRWAQTTLGIYLIHEHSAVRTLLWQAVDNRRLSGGLETLTMAVFISLAVFLLGSLLACLINKWFACLKVSIKRSYQAIHRVVFAE